MIYLLAVLLALSPFHLKAEESSFKVIKDLATLPLLNPSYHDQKIEKIELANGLQAILVSDPHVKQSAVTMTVMAGSWQEPDEFHGLAHFLEHMLFMGTEEYPDESSFTRFLTEHGGQTNAFTHGDYTSYMFALNTDGFSEGLKRFASFFKTPLLNPAGISRELNAIDQEFAQGFNNEDTRLYFVLKDIASPLHPFSRFQTGNSQSLAKASTDDLRKWFETHYSADLMKLYVLSSEPIEEIQEQVIRDFSGIKDRDVKHLHNLNPLFTKEALGHLVRIAPKNATQSLLITWEIPAQYPKMLESRPVDVVCTAIGYEGKNSLLALLKKEGLADSLGCGTVDLSSQVYLMTIEMKLTNKGLEQLDTVIEKVFQTIHMIAKHPFPDYVFEDYALMLKGRYQFEQRDEPFEWAMNQGSQLAQEPIATYPELTKTLQVLDKAAISSFLEFLTPQNGIFVLTAPSPKLDKMEPWMQIPYSIEPIAETKLKAWSEASPSSEVNFPAKNPFLAHTLTATKAIVDKDIYPAITPPSAIFDSKGGKVYYAQDPFYQVPRSAILLQIQTPEIKDSKPRSVVMTDIYVHALRDNIRDLIDQAEMADLDVSIDRSLGGIVISIEGFTESLKAFFPYVIPKLTSIELTQGEFTLLRDSIQRGYENNVSAAPVKQAFDKFKATIFENFVNFNQKRASINKITLPIFQNFQNNLFNKTYIKGSITGSISEKEAKDMIASLDQILHKTPGSDAAPYYPKIKASSDLNGPIVYSFNTKADGDAVILSLEVNGYSPTLRNVQEMLSQTMSEAFFSELRTKQQVGYIVFSESMELQKHLFNIFGAQSTTHTPTELIWRFELFIASYLDELTTNIPKERFETLKKSLTKQLQTPPATLKQFNENIFRLGFEMEDFEWTIKRLDALNNLTYADFLAISKSYLSRENKQRVALSITGQHPDTVPFEYKNYKKPKEK